MTRKVSSVGLAVVMVSVCLVGVGTADAEVLVSVAGSALSGGPYELWGGNAPCPEEDHSIPGYYSAPNYGYELIGTAESDSTFTVTTPYGFYLVATRGEMSLDSIGFMLADDWQYLEGERNDHPIVTWGNVHLPYQFDNDGALIGDFFDYAHDDYIWGSPDGQSDHVGLPASLGGSGGTFQGFVVFEVPEPATLALLGIGGVALLRRRRAA